MAIKNLAYLLTNIRNSLKLGRAYVYAPYSKVNLTVLKILLKNAFIKDLDVFYDIKNPKIKKLKVFLNYTGFWNLKNRISELRLMSYKNRVQTLSYKQIPYFIKAQNLSKNGLLILTTSSGILDHKEALRLHKGGSLLCIIS